MRVSVDPPHANSSRLVLPTNTPPAFHKRSVTVDSYGYRSAQHQARVGVHTLGAQIVFDRQWKPGKAKTLTSGSQLVEAIGFTSGPSAVTSTQPLRQGQRRLPPEMLVNQLTGG